MKKPFTRGGAFAAMALAAVLSATALPEAKADHWTGGSGHWSNHEWPGVYAPNSVPVRAFYIFDRSGNGTVSAALQQVLGDLKYDLDARGWWGYVPAPVYVDDNVNAGQCTWYPEFNQYHFITLCSDGRSGGITWSAGDHDAEPWHSHIWVGTNGGTYPYAAIYNITYHELLHAMGLRNGPCGQGQHSCDPANLMYPVVPTNTIKRPTGHDYDALGAFYLNHWIYS